MATRTTINRRNRNRGKTHEKRIAEMLDGVRLGTMGGVDVNAGWAAVECKSTSSMPAYLRDYYTQAVSHCRPGQIPVVALHEKGKQYDHDFILFRLDDFLNLFAPLLAGHRPSPVAGVEADLRELHESLSRILNA